MGEGLAGLRPGSREDFDRLYDVEPLYMRRTQAEINWESRSLKS